MKVNKLSDFGYSFQIKLISALFKDKVFLQQIIDILDSSYFDSEANIVILDMIKGYFKTVILISHLDSLKDCVDMQINIEKKAGFAHVNI